MFATLEPALEAASRGMVYAVADLCLMILRMNS